mmetsp:Transcript_13705/g.29234  ORF Transcript_13705/g.29234 Transcript_13705/m.29234 type:complete len:165 (-) Transcript_13705:43-537(-)
MESSDQKNVRPADADDLQTSIATSNSKLNSNPYCRVSLLHCEDSCIGTTDSVDDTAAQMKANTVRFIDKPMEVPPAMYFDCSKIRKLDKVFSRKVEDPSTDVPSDECQAPEPSDPDETCFDGDSHPQAPKPDDSPRRKYPKRNPSPLCTTARAAKHVVIQTVAS